MKLFFTPYTLQLKHVFTVAAGSRTTTPLVLTRIEHEGITGYGEASMPPYLGESQESVMKFLSQIDLSRFRNPLEIEEVLQYVDSLAPGNNSAKASVDIALHDLAGKIAGKPLYEMWGLNRVHSLETSFTIGIDTPEMIRQKVMEADPFAIYKIKLGQENDREIIEAVRSQTDKPLFVDVNQGWKDKNMALDMILWLKEQGVLLVEQPMPAERIDDLAWLASESPIPVLADEGIKRFDDVARLKDVYSGVNIKLMKSTGLFEAKRMAEFARANGLKVMIGCMTETSCAVTAASHLTPLADFADLDGPFLIKNDPFEGMKVQDGKIITPDQPGIGVMVKT